MKFLPTERFAVAGLLAGSAAYESGLGAAHVLRWAETARMPEWAAAVRPMNAAAHFADGSPARLERDLQAHCTQRRPGASPIFFLSEGCANTGLGELSTMSESSLTAGCAALESAPVLHFASGPTMTLLPTGECLAAFRRAASADACSSGSAARTYPFLLDGLEASAAFWRLGSAEGASGARTMVAATDLAISRAVLFELLDDLWAACLERRPGQGFPGDALLLLATGEQLPQQQEPIRSAADPRCAALLSIWAAAATDIARTQLAAREAPTVGTPFSLAPRPLPVTVLGAASRDETMRVGEALAARLRMWAEADVSDVCSPTGAASLVSLLWSALTLGAQLPKLERRSVTIRVGACNLMTDGLPAAAWMRPYAPNAADPTAEAAALEWRQAAAAWRQGGTDLTIVLGSRAVEMHFWC